MELTTQSMANREHDQTVENNRALAKKLDVVSWGLFFIWLGWLSSRTWAGQLDSSAWVR